MVTDWTDKYTAVGAVGAGGFQSSRFAQAKVRWELGSHGKVVVGGTLPCLLLVGSHSLEFLLVKMCYYNLSIVIRHINF